MLFLVKVLGKESIFLSNSTEKNRSLIINDLPWFLVTPSGFKPETF
jgi:hypothetical protein